MPGLLPGCFRSSTRTRFYPVAVDPGIGIETAFARGGRSMRSGAGIGIVQVPLHHSPDRDIFTAEEKQLNYGVPDNGFASVRRLADLGRLGWNPGLSEIFVGP